MNPKQIKDVFENVSLELLIFGLSAAIGVNDGMRHDNQNSVDFFTGGLYLAIPFGAARVARLGVRDGIRDGIEIGSLMYASYLVGRTTVEFFRRYV